MKTDSLTRIRNALNSGGLELPQRMPVVEIDVEDYVDWTGEDGLNVTVTLSDETDVDGVTGLDVSDFKLAVRDRILELGEERFAYIEFQTESERDQALLETP